MSILNFGVLLVPFKVENYTYEGCFHVQAINTKQIFVLKLQIRAMMDVWMLKGYTRNNFLLKKFADALQFARHILQLHFPCDRLHNLLR